MIHLVLRIFVLFSFLLLSNTPKLMHRSMIRQTLKNIFGFWYQRSTFFFYIVVYLDLFCGCPIYIIQPCRYHQIITDMLTKLLNGYDFF